MLTVIYELDNGYRLIQCSSFIIDEMYRSLFYFLDMDIRYFNYLKITSLVAAPNSLTL